MKDVMRRSMERVQSLVSGQVDARALAVFRIMVGLSVWFEARENVARLGQYTPGQYHIEYAGLSFDWTLPQMQLFCEWQMRFAVAIVLGLFSRVFALAALACQASLFLVSQLNFRNHVFLMLVFLLCIALSQSDRAWGATALVQRLRGRPAQKTASSFGPSLIQAQVFFIYLYSGLHKLLLGFGAGYALCRYLGREIPRGRSAGMFGDGVQAWVAENMNQAACVEGAPGLIVAASVGTIVAEIGLAFGLLHRRTVIPAIVVGLGLHASIFATMDVVTFGAMMVATYPLFLVRPPLNAAQVEAAEVAVSGEEAHPAD